MHTFIYDTLKTDCPCQGMHSTLKNPPSSQQRLKFLFTSPFLYDISIKYSWLKFKTLKNEWLNHQSMNQPMTDWINEWTNVFETSEAYSSKCFIYICSKHIHISSKLSYYSPPCDSNWANSDWLIPDSELAPNKNRWLGICGELK